nr:uncharacterized protein LOC119619938 [Chlorocebus sabaeus]
MCRRPAWASVPANPLADVPCPAGEPRLLLLPVTAHFPVTGILAKPNQVGGGGSAIAGLGRGTACIHAMGSGRRLCDDSMLHVLSPWVRGAPCDDSMLHVLSPWVRGAPCDDSVLHGLSPWVRGAPCDDSVLHGTRSHCRTQRVPGAWPCSCLAELFLLELLCLRLCPGILGPSVPGQQQDSSDLVPSPGQLCCRSPALPAWGVTLPLPTHWFSTQMLLVTCPGHTDTVQRPHGVLRAQGVLRLCVAASTEGAFRRPLLLRHLLCGLDRGVWCCWGWGEGPSCWSPRPACRAHPLHTRGSRPRLVSPEDV